jgi:hypothetical protein
MGEDALERLLLELTAQEDGAREVRRQQRPGVPRQLEALEDDVGEALAARQVLLECRETLDFDQMDLLEARRAPERSRSPPPLG